MPPRIPASGAEGLRRDLVDASFEHRAFAGVGHVDAERSISASTTADALSKWIFSVSPPR